MLKILAYIPAIFVVLYRVFIYNPFIRLTKRTGWYYYYDVYTFRKRHFTGRIPDDYVYISGSFKGHGLRLYEWVLLNRDNHKRYASMFYLIHRIMDNEPLVKSQYLLAKTEYEAGIPNELSYILTKENFDTYDASRSR